MSEKPILFCGEMVNAIIAGRKTQTRRIVKEAFMQKTQGLMMEGEEGDWCPYGGPGGRLWVKETWKPCFTDGSGTAYRADNRGNSGPWKPSIFMPHKRSRLTLEIVSVRVERVQGITHGDAMDEGVEPNCPTPCPKDCPQFVESRRCKLRDEYIHYQRGEEGFPAFSPKESFRSLWDSINAKRGYGWDVNPWVWRIEFRVSEKQKGGAA